MAASVKKNAGNLNVITIKKRNVFKNNQKTVNETDCMWFVINYQNDIMIITVLLSQTIINSMKFDKIRIFLIDGYFLPFYHPFGRIIIPKVPLPFIFVWKFGPTFAKKVVQAFFATKSHVFEIYTLRHIHHGIVWRLMIIISPRHGVFLNNVVFWQICFKII